MVGRKGKNTIKAGTQAQADRILQEQEELINKVCDGVTDIDEGILHASARNKAVARVIDEYTTSKLAKQDISVKALNSMEESVTRTVTQKLKDIATDFDLDATYYNRDKLLTYL